MRYLKEIILSLVVFCLAVDNNLLKLLEQMSIFLGRITDDLVSRGVSQSLAQSIIFVLIITSVLVGATVASKLD